VWEVVRNLNGDKVPGPGWVHNGFFSKVLV
jgi:hypothetical protein